HPFRVIHRRAGNSGRRRGVISDSLKRHSWRVRPCPRGTAIPIHPLRRHSAHARRRGPSNHSTRTTHYMTTATTAPATKQVAINDIGSAEDFLAAVEKTLKFFNDGD